MGLVTPGDELMMLELLNSTPMVAGEPRDELEGPSGTRRWLAAHGQKGSVEEAKTLLELRPLLQEVVRGTKRSSVLAPFIADVGCAARLTTEGIAWNLALPPGRSAAARIVLAWDELRRSSPGRLRPCANPECRRFLIDHSKPNSARWCSMAICGNRMKARRHHHKSREAVQK
ncbi:CGNR zinc finger domain-containing protein [Kitasatospora sp. NPDC052896]|uniref:CGNR zinc finger domain-containing protein n=1 Tax=Kitasatospora sp. NPDC052896 TaxID=3364061 RepID=UPI0037CA050A